MDERIDLTDNRDFRDSLELKSSKIIPKEITLTKYVHRSLLQKIKEESKYTKKIILNAGSLSIDEEYSVIDDKNTCYKCGRKLITNNSTLCDKCDVIGTSFIF